MFKGTSEAACVRPPSGRVGLYATPFCRIYKKGPRPPIVSAYWSQIPLFVSSKGILKADAPTRPWLRRISARRGAAAPHTTDTAASNTRQRISACPQIIPSVACSPPGRTRCCTALLDSMSIRVRGTSCIVAQTEPSPLAMSPPGVESEPIGTLVEPRFGYTLAMRRPS